MNPEAQPYVGKKSRTHVNPVPPPPPPSGSSQTTPPYLQQPFLAPPPPTAMGQTTKLRAVAPAFQPKSPTSPNNSTTAPPPPPPMPPPPEYAASPLSSQKSTDSDGFKALNFSAAPYTPKKRSPTSRGAPTFPDAPAPPMPVAANLHPAALQDSPVASAASSPTSPLPPPPQPAESASIDPFAKSSLTVPVQPKAAPAEKMEFHSAWSLWADDHPLAAPGEQKQFVEPVLIRDVTDLESFWTLWWHCPPPSACTPSWTYNWFRRTIKPVWEDPRNKNGGTISFTVYDHDKPNGLTRQVVDDTFMLVVMGLCGESIPEAAAINGVSLKIRAHRPVVIQLWTNASDKSRLASFVAGLRSVVQRVLPAKQIDKLEYYSHTRMHQHTQAASSGSNRFAKATKSAKALEPDFTFRDTD